MYPVSSHCVSCLRPPETARLQDVLQSQARELDKANKVGSSVRRGGICVGMLEKINSDSMYRQQTVPLWDSG